MAGDVGEAPRADAWGPVARGFRVSLPNGEHGWVEEIRVCDGAVDLVVATGSAAGRLVTVGADAIEAILPGARRIVVHGSDAAVVAREAAAELEVAGGIVRMPVRESARLGLPTKEAA